MASETDPTSFLSDKEEAGVEVEYIGNEEEGNEIEVEQEQAEYSGEDYTPLSSNEDPDKQHAFKDYKRLERDIKYHNKSIENLKDEIQLFEQRPCLTRSEKHNLKILRETIEREMEKLKCLVNKAIQLQNFGSKRHYREFPLVTTFDEDNLNLTQRTCETLQDHSIKSHVISGNWRASAGESSEMDGSYSCKESQISLSEERKLIKEILAAIKECSNLKENSQQKQKRPVPCKENDSMEKLKNKIKCMQQTICKLNDELNKRQNVCNHQPNQKSLAGASEIPVLDPAMLCLSKNSAKANDFQQLKENYLYLLTEFSKKDELLKELTKKLRNSCGKCNNSGAGEGIAQADITSADESEIHLLRNRINEMNEEQIEFKCLMKEQSLQLDDYRNKYLTAQQKVEEQNALIEKLNMNNKRIEKQINQEVKEIRAKFQEKLADLLHFPKLLENEQLKLAQKCKEKEELEVKLGIVCKELKNQKTKQQNITDEDCKPQLNRCQQELAQVKKNIEEIQRQRDMFCEKLRTIVEDLNTLRSESAKIIARTKERAELIKQQQQEHINRLEKQLAQCRATACVSVSDRECVIKEMQGQLNSLSYSFDAAQKQIKTLRNHIAYMSNENSFPAKC